MIILGCGIRQTCECDELIWRGKFVSLALNYRISFIGAIKEIINYERAKIRDRKAHKMIDALIEETPADSSKFFTNTLV